MGATCVHVAPFFGEKPIGDITKDDIEQFVAVRLDNHQSIKSTRNYLGFVHSVFDFALRNGPVVANPCKAVEKPEAVDEDQDIRFLDQAELDALMATAAGPRTRRKAGRLSAQGDCDASPTARRCRGKLSQPSSGSPSRRRLAVPSRPG